jgi:hypothetical protein
MSELPDIVARVNAILLMAWDPIGIADVSAARDEYEMYASQIVRMLAKHATVRSLAAHLLAVETERMGLPGDRVRAEQAASKLRALVAHGE